ncbi:hypothetical protein I6A60_25045 [Frankia sp. AgB1.9]|uniref:hypothetical protein n=1 Tax=unclassified Frankia TaxID=2632575 RepID=UPI0019317D92|nr:MULTISPECIES: hypothetical protein [unclassified Frankia]MBL7494112.1 hypothetical protein [Frankia sp. AgW1.1]MBL7551107.1 hypothetical protein [Frankia sp. AgB1.9]MBL7624727.1 hypothetical protein [Frankia sp. AgB1.8]
MTETPAHTPATPETIPLRERPGVRIVDWNKDRHPQGQPGEVIATLFSLVLGDRADPDAVRFTHARMAPGSGPRLWHAHADWTASIVLEGSLTVEGVTLTAGQLVAVAPDVAYGPLTPGPAGATVLEIFASARATQTQWDDDDPRVGDYRRRGWILDPPTEP